MKRSVMPEVLLGAALAVSLPLLAQAYLAGSGAVPVDATWLSTATLVVAAVRGIATAVTLTYGLFCFGHALASPVLRHRYWIAAIWLLTLLACVLLAWPYTYAKVGGQELSALPDWILGAMTLCQILAPELVAVGAAMLLADPDYRAAATIVDPVRQRRVSAPAQQRASAQPAQQLAPAQLRAVPAQLNAPAQLRGSAPAQLRSVPAGAPAHVCGVCAREFGSHRALNAHRQYCKAQELQG